MRAGSAELRNILPGSFDYHWEADLYYAGQRRLQTVPVSEPVFREDGDQRIQHTGSLTVVWSDEFATSVLPRNINDPLAPFGAQLYVYCVIEAGGYIERVEFARFEITDVPAARDEQMRFRSGWLTVGSTVELELKDVFAGLGEESFDVPTVPAGLSSTWDEVARVTGLPVYRTVTDAPIPRSVLYPESKLDAVYELMGVVLDAVPHVTADGAVAARSNTWPSPVDTLFQSSPSQPGTIVEVGAVMSAEDVCNRVVVRATSGEQTSVLAVAEITSGPLRVRNADGSVSPFRARTRYLSSELVTTRVQAEAWANSELRQRSVIRSRVVPVVETFNPLRERGDILLIERPTEWIVGRVLTITRGTGPTMDMTVEVLDTFPPEVST